MERDQLNMCNETDQIYIYLNTWINTRKVCILCKPFIYIFIFGKQWWNGMFLCTLYFFPFFTAQQMLTCALNLNYGKIKVAFPMSAHTNLNWKKVNGRWHIFFPVSDWKCKVTQRSCVMVFQTIMRFSDETSIDCIGIELVCSTGIECPLYWTLVSI